MTKGRRHALLQKFPNLTLAIARATQTRVATTDAGRRTDATTPATVGDQQHGFIRSTGIVPDGHLCNRAMCLRGRQEIQDRDRQTKEEIDMCDFSLHSVSNRLAVVGDELFVHLFHTGSKGLASKADFEKARPHFLKRIAFSLLNPGEKIIVGLPAVCVPHGARLRLSGIPRW